MKTANRFVFLTAIILGVLYGSSSEAKDQRDLAEAFVNPPDSAKPHTWWHWMNGNVTKDGITADLEAMARIGVGGAQIFNASEGIPHGPVDFNSPEWIDMVKHAAKESRRLGLELCIHNCAGWSSSGGPWNTPEHSMKVVVTSEKQLAGPSEFDGLLPQPPSKLDFYRDIAVLAFRTPVGERISMRNANPDITLSDIKINSTASRVVDGNSGTFIQLGLPKSKKPAFVLLEFAEPFTARMITLTPGPGMRGCSGKIECSDDGRTFRSVDSFSMSKGAEVRTFYFKPVSSRFYRVLFSSANSRMRHISIAEIELSAKVGIENLSGKIFLDRGGNYNSTLPSDVEKSAVVQRDQIVDLTSRLKADSHLTWDVPAGDWTILRIGYTANGRQNHPAPKEGTGLECDKLSREAVQAHWDGHMAKILAALGKYAGHADSGLNDVLIDSYEVGTQNWTQNFQEAFKKRRGYDLTRFLPVFTGRVVDSPEITERFLWDLRRTIADMFAENYSGKFAEMAHKAGLKYSVEPYGNCPSDNIQYGSYSDIPMSEFWPGSGANPGNAKLAASIAHVYGKKFAGAESFTAAPKAGKWQQDPFSLKAQGDAVYCAGVNRIIYHRYAHQPWTHPTRYPGMTMGQWGTHFERTVTWWNQGRDWLKYQARCQYLLQQGVFVADVCFYNGEDAPNSLRGGGLPQGYDYDGCDTGALSLMAVKNGRIILPSGMSYRILALPGEKTMTPQTLKVIKNLADAGATIVGPKPVASPSLSDYPACDTEVKKLAEGLWPGKVTDCSPGDALTAMGVKPDFTCNDKSDRVHYIHRVAQGADIYFVASHGLTVNNVECTFRVSGKIPELWYPDTGIIEVAPVFTEHDGCTTVPLRFNPAGSVFVVFRKTVADDHVVSVLYEPTAAEKKPVYELKILKVEYGAFNDDVDPECKDVTKRVKDILRGGGHKVRADNSLGGDPAPNFVKELKVDFLLNGVAKSVRVEEKKTLELPEDAEVVRAVYGLIVEKPEPQKQTVDLTDKVAALVKDGTLSVKMDNTFAGGDPARLILKEARVDYIYKGQTKHITVRENQILTLPEENERMPAPPAYTLKPLKKGTLEVSVWQPGVFDIATAEGHQFKVDVNSVPNAFDLLGSWELSFPPNWGAPAKITLDKLISWTDYPDKGVKYFSGTAEYSKVFNWDLKKQKDEHYVLDLGDLKNIAEVSLNDKDLGIIWKPPYRVDVTKTIRSGKNKLRVKITNLWPNRLIGDEFLPEDREWEGMHLKEWPQWLLDGKPSPTGRFTFTTWHHWTKEDEPLPSGLFGPVCIRTVKIVTLK